MKRPLFWVCIALAILAVLNFVWSGAADETGKFRQTLSEDPPWEGQTVCLSGRVCEKGSQGEKEYFILTDLSSEDPSSDLISDQNAAASRQIISKLCQLKTEKLQCFLAKETGGALPKIGSRVVVEGIFSLFQVSTNPGEFNYARYYQGKQIGGKLSDVSLLDMTKKYNRLREGLYAVRSYFGRRLDKVFPIEEAGILRTMLLGDRTELSPQVRELYQDGGILHVLSISGLHVTLLGMGLYQLLRRLYVRMDVAALCAGSVLVLYGIMTGMSVSACRAIGMFLLRMLAVLWGRTYDLLTATAVLACGMLCLVPTYGMNSGFWLSFGSILGIGVVLPVLETAGRNLTMLEIGNATAGHSKACDDPRLGRKILFLIDRGFHHMLQAIRQGIRAGLSVFLATLPVTLYFYFEVPTYSMLLNLLVIPAMGPVIFFGFLAMLIPGLGILGTVDVVILKAFTWLCEQVRALPFSSWNPGCPGNWQIVGYYVLLSMALTFLWKIARKREEIQDGGLRQREDDGVGVRVKGNVRPIGKSKLIQWLRNCISRKGWLAWGLLILPILILTFPARRMTGAVFLDVGQGDSILLRLSNGQTWIYDCGSSNRNEVGKNILIPYLKHEGIRHIDGIFVSHGDRDHVSGLKELFQMAGQEEIRIDHLYLPSWMYSEEATDEEMKSVQMETENERRNSLDAVKGEAAKFEVSKNEASLVEFAKSMKKMQIHVLKAGDSLDGQAISFLTLHPQKLISPAELDGNEASLCLLVQLKKQGRSLTILLTGDTQGEGEKELLAELKGRGINKVDVLKCAHHGSKYATSSDFLAQIDAELTVISCGRRNSYGHPHAELLQRLSDDGTAILRTDQLGAITIYDR
ncbi:MAG: DNA internalization-related competence protein ComEC/Rec2 [Lachnospiraceae bacterium]|nr:DNA internalization-related competence protein ComEC/Rec2 [Lachnospiraceae bacterium]